MVSTKRLFRNLVLLDVFLGIIALVMVTMEPPFLPEPLQAYLKAHQAEFDKSPNFLLGIITFLLLALMIISTVGLYKFWRPARNLYLFSITGAYIIGPFFGPVVTSGISGTLSGLGNALSGILITMAFMSPLK